MSVRPILFSGPMVRALIAQRKTQTRRMLAPSNTYYDGYTWPKGRWEEMDWSAAWVDPGPSPAGNPGPYLKVPRLDGETTHRVYPKTQPGDVLWVRESWVQEDSSGWGPQPCYNYMADHLGDPAGLGWRPSIHMPRIASRLTLEVTSVKVERLNEISDEDATAEGIARLRNGQWHWANHERTDFEQHGYHTPRGAYDALWGEINGPESWPSNPWVVAGTFTVHQSNIDTFLKDRETAKAGSTPELANAET